MTATPDKPTSWRRRAVELRRLAALTNDPVARQTLLEAASLWDSIADRVAQVEASYPDIALLKAGP